MQPSYALLPAISYSETVGGVCYAVIGAQIVGLKVPISKQPIRDQETK